MNHDQHRPSELPDAPALLRDAAAAHHPDRARMLARVERGLGGEDRPRRRAVVRSWWPRAVLAAGATLGIAVAGGLAVAAIGQAPAPQPVRTELAPGTPSPNAATDAAPSPTAPSGPPSPRAGTSGVPAPPAPSPSAPTASGPVGTPSSPPAPSARAFAPSGTRAADGPLTADGSIGPDSNDFWAERTVTLTAHEPLTALTVELRVALTPGVADAGHWQTRPGGDFTFSVQPEGGDLVYRWTLRPGTTLPAGPYVFAAQFDHAPGKRDPGGDGYHAEATAPSAQASVWGGFGGGS